MINASSSFQRFLEQSAAIAAAAQPIVVRGRLTRVAGLVMEAVGLKLPLGSQVFVVQDESLRVDAEVVGFSGERLFLMPTSEPVGLRTVGRGQRMGLFAGAGVGKSVLLGMMARFTSADVTVVGLVGERGREVKEFIEDILGTHGLKRAVVVAAPADTPPLLRMQGAA